MINLNQRYIFFLCFIFFACKGICQEICNNGIDDDNDQLVDLNDPDCDCDEVQVDLLIPNPSFEEFDCCPDDLSQMSCATDWIQASGGTTDYFNYCGFYDVQGAPPPYPIPDGDGVIRFINAFYMRDDQPGRLTYKEYAGACLNSPMLAGTDYNLSLDLGFLNAEKSPDITLSIYGTPSCDNLPFGGVNDTDCPTAYPNWYLLDAKHIENVPNAWTNVSFNLSPAFDVEAIAIGPDCVFLDKANTFYYLDRLNLYELNSDILDFELLDRGAQCNPNFVFAVAYNSSYSYQWYKGGVALAGETNSKLSQMYGNGRYQLTIDDGNDCRRSADYVYSVAPKQSSVTRTICEGSTYTLGSQVLSQAGEYSEVVKTNQGCDSLVNLTLLTKEPFLDTIEATLLAGDVYETAQGVYTESGIYTNSYSTAYGCDSTLVYKLKFSDVYVPSAISPNADGVNDSFKILDTELEIESQKITIYNRWGNKVFEGEEWNGRGKDNQLIDGTFLYHVQALLADGTTIEKAGTLTVISSGQ